MLKIDCLLVNTEVANTVKQIIGYLGHKGIAEDKDVSFRGMYNELRKNGVEVDLETAAHIYASELPLHDARFTPIEDLKYDTGRWFDDIVRDITLQKPKKGEQEIGELSPAQAAVKAFANAFSSNVKGDESTKSVLKTLEDIYKNAGKRMLGELPNKENGKDERTSAEIIQQALDNESIGYRDVADGTIKGLAKMHDEVRREISELTAHMEAEGDHDKLEQWNNYAKSLEDASYTMLFTSNEAKKVLHDALAEKGFTKETKSGKEVLDWEKLSGNINSYEQLRENVIEGLKNAGIPEDITSRIADSMHKEFRDIRGKILDTLDRKKARIADTWSTASENAKTSLPEMVDKRVKEWNNHRTFEGHEDEPLNFSQTEAKMLIGDALKTSEKYGMDFAADKRAINWLNMKQDPPSKTPLELMVKDRLIEQGVSEEAAKEAAFSVVRDYHETLSQKIDENAKRLLDNRQAAIDRELPARKSALSRLGELHDLGMFEGGHDRLLSHVLGIDPEDVEAIRGVKEYADKLSQLRQLLSGNDFIVPSVVHTLNREIHQIIAPLVADKTRAMKVVSAINKMYQVENSMLISTHGNILENHLSGAMELLTTNLSQRLRFGGELGGFHAQDRKLMADYYGHIAAGGAENGLAPYQVGGNKERLSDKYTVHKMKGADWSKPSTWAKGMATAVMTIPRTFLSGADAAVKIGLMNAHMKSSVIDGLIAAHKGEMSKDDAIKFYNDAIYGEGQLEKAKLRAEELYKKIGLKYVSQKELNITANELLRENLIQDGGMKPEDLEEAMKNAYHEAGLGMGHETNNFISERQQAWKQTLNRKENQAISDHDWNKAAKIRMTNTVLNDVIFRFAASRFNWAWIRAQQAGVGVLTGLIHYSSNNRKYRNIDVFDAKKMNEAAIEYQAARQKLARGMVGIGINATGYFAAKAIANALNPDSEDPMEEMFDQLKGNYGAKALYLKVSPLWMLQSYEYNEIKKATGAERALGGLTKDFINLTNVGDAHDISVQMAQFTKDISKAQSYKQQRKAYADLGSIVNNSLPHVPLVKQGKNVMTFANYLSGKPSAPMPPYPQGFMQGLLGGGVIQDVLGLFPANKLPESLEEWGEGATTPVKTTSRVQ